MNLNVIIVTLIFPTSFLPNTHTHVHFSSPALSPVCSNIFCSSEICHFFHTTEFLAQVPQK